MKSTNDHWVRVLSREQFVKLISNRSLVGDGNRFVLHSDGRISGQIDGAKLSGNWHWEEAYFCRTATIDGNDLDHDREAIELRGNYMRYTRNEGHGDAFVVKIVS